MSLPPFAPENLGQAISAALPELQAAAESMMRDTCRITREPAGDADWVIVDGREVPAEWSEVYVGPCRVRSYQPYESTPEVGGASETVQRYAVHVPVSAGPFEPGDRVEITTNPARARAFRVAATHEVTNQTAQQLSVEEVH